MALISGSGPGEDSRPIPTQSEAANWIQTVLYTNPATEISITVVTFVLFHTLLVGERRRILAYSGA